MMSEHDESKQLADAPGSNESPAVPAPAPKPKEPPVEDFAAMLAASEAPNAGRKELKVGDLVRGRVIAVGQSSAFVAIGAKGEAQIDIAEFRDPATGAVSIAEGDTIEATVTDDGGRSGSIKLKHTLG